MKRKELLRHLEAHGCRLVREGGRYTFYADSTGQRFSAIPRHMDINKITARSICRDLGVPPPKSL